MPLTLHTLQHPSGAKRTRKVIGRGNASGHGTYAGRGQKGQKARTGGRKGLKRKGLRMMLLRIPKRRGIGNRQGSPVRVLNLEQLDRVLADGARVDRAALVALGLINARGQRVKILGAGEWQRKGITFIGLAFSEAARSKVMAGGSTIENGGKK